MEYLKDDFNWELKTSKPLRVLIVGAGVAGLSTGIGLTKSGHNVTIFEQVPEIAEVGAGIQMAPNNTRILARFGVLEEIMRHTNMLEKNSIRRWQNNEELGTAPLMPGVANQYNAPMGSIHRGDLQRILLQSAKDAGVDIRTGQPVVKCADDFSAKVQLKSGEWVSGDLVIAADGIKSDIRKQIATAHSHVDKAMPTGDAAYRILIPRAKMEHDPRALELLESNAGTRWMGPGGHIMAYPIKNNQLYNMVLIHPQKPGTENDESWNRKGDKQEMLDFYRDWNDLVKSLLAYVPPGEVMEWTLNSHRQLPAWHENRVVLIGDACHPMLPYVAQGAAQAIEDAGALTAILSHAAQLDLPDAIAIYEMVRKRRGEAIQDSASAVQKTLHLPDGPAQRSRDAKIKAAAAGRGDNPDLWADKSWQNFMWGTDVMKDVMERWDEFKSAQWRSKL